MNTLPSELSRVVVSTDQIQSRVKELADQISADFAGGEPLYHRNPERCLHIPGRSYAEPGCTPHGRLHGLEGTPAGASGNTPGLPTHARNRPTPNAYVAGCSRPRVRCAAPSATRDFEDPRGSAAGGSRSGRIPPRRCCGRGPRRSRSRHRGCACAVAAALRAA